MTEDELLERITTDPAIFGGKPIIRAAAWGQVLTFNFSRRAYRA